jgi:hypothetical protein
MIRREDKEDGIRFRKLTTVSIFSRTDSRSHNRRRGISPHWLQHNLPLFLADFLQLFCDKKAMIIVADHQRRGYRWEAIQTINGILKHTLIVHQADKLLGTMGS